MKAASHTVSDSLLCQADIGVLFLFNADKKCQHVQAATFNFM